MQLDLSPKGVIEKVATTLLLGLLYAAYGFYLELADLVDMKPQLRAVQQYLVNCPCSDPQDEKPEP